MSSSSQEIPDADRTEFPYTTVHAAADLSELTHYPLPVAVTVPFYG